VERLEHVSALLEAEAGQDDLLLRALEERRSTTAVSRAVALLRSGPVHTSSAGGRVCDARSAAPPRSR
jgi:hypothetical protein